MEKHIYLCDHCGKELDEMVDIISGDFELPDYFVNSVDLCNDCYQKIKNIIIEYTEMDKTNNK